MAEVLLSIALVLLVIYIIPIIVYGLLSKAWGLKIPQEASPLTFLVSVFISKIGTAITFVLLFYFVRISLSGNFLLYAFLWWVMFALGEIGQSIGPNYSWKEATAGIISETFYLPFSAYIVNSLT